ncbi:unnamed protein product [Ilex paraguariensis]|uniref:Uncharacterized protein n=1 Tax=Ilex paraguariensis TaxID=185542 RepID=A0ABC8THW8_9AQUA
MGVKYKMSNEHICQDNVCFKTSVVLVKNMTDKVILCVPFIYLLYPFTTYINGLTAKPFGQKVTFKFLTKPQVKKLRQLKECSISMSLNLITQKTNEVKFLTEEINHKRVQEQLANPILIKKIEEFKTKMEAEVCSNLPPTFWHRKKHMVKLPYSKGFSEQNTPTKSRPIQMTHEVMKICKKEISELFKMVSLGKVNLLGHVLLSMSSKMHN